MNFETILEIAYHVSGILVVMFFLFVVNTLRKEKQEVVKSRIFIKYNKFKAAFYIAFTGAALFLLGNVLGLYNHAAVHWIHEVTEILYNICLAVFVGILYFIISTKRQKKEETQDARDKTRTEDLK